MERPGKCKHLSSWEFPVEGEDRSIVENWCNQRYTDRPEIISVADDQTEVKTAVEVAQKRSQLSCEVCDPNFFHTNQ